MRSIAHASALALLAACSSAAEPVSAPPVSVAPVVTTVAPATTVAPPTTVAAPTGPSRDEVTRARARIADGRRAEAAGDHAAALAAFDDALQVVSRDPRLLCEAGFIAHRAGRTQLAATRIDTALGLFGSPATAPPSEHVHLAQCLYNRGLVDVALGDTGSAVDHFTASIALRPNTTVQHALDAARDRRAPTGRHDSMGGVPVDVGDRSIFVHAATREVLEGAMRVGFAGMPGDEARYASEDTRVDALAEEQVDGHTMVVYRVGSSDGMYVDESLVVAFAGEGGWTLIVARAAVSNADRGDVDELGTVHVSRLGAAVRIDASGHSELTLESFAEPDANGVTCQAIESDAYELTVTVVCRAAPSPGCFRVGYETSRAAYDRECDPMCYGADGNEAEPVQSPCGDPHVAGFALEVAAIDDGFAVTGTGAIPASMRALVGTHSFDAWVATSGTEAPTGFTDREHARVLADYAQ